MAAYKQDLKVSYGDFDFPVPTPYVTRTYRQEYVGGKLWGTAVDISISGQIAILPKRETVGGNNYSALSKKRDKIAKEFAGALGKNFQTLKVIGHDTSFILNNCVVGGVSFSSSNYVGIVDYSVSLVGRLDDVTGGKDFYGDNYGVTSPMDTWSYSENDGIGSLTHTVSALGYHSDTSGSKYNAFLKAKSFVESRKGLASKISTFFIQNIHPDSALILTNLSENVNRLEGSYSVTENYKFATNRSSEPAGLEIGLPNPQTKNILTTYTTDLSEEHGSDFVQVSLSGQVSGSKDTAVLWTSIRDDFKALQFYDLANKAYINHIKRTGVNIELNKSPVSFNIKPDKDSKKISFNIVYDNNLLYSSAKFKNGGAYFNYNLNFSHDTIRDIITVQCKGSILTRASLKKSNRQAKILLDELLEDNMKKVREEAERQYYVMFPDRTQYKLTLFPKDASASQNPNTGMISLGASFSDTDHFRDQNVLNSSFSIRVDVPNQEFRNSSSCLTNGSYMVYNLGLKTKRETVDIECDGSCSSGDEEKFNISVAGIEDLNEKLKNAFVKGNIQRLDSESKVANLTPNDITFNRTLSHEKAVVNFNLDRKT
jgi:hypothetical protein